MDGKVKVRPVFFFSREYWTAAMAGSSGDSVTRRSVASQFFTQEEGLGIDVMTTSERVSVGVGLRVGGHGPGHAEGAGLAGQHRHLPLPSFQVVDLLNQAALITSDSKITVLKQVKGRDVGRGKEDW